VVKDLIGILVDLPNQVDQLNFFVCRPNFCQVVLAYGTWRIVSIGLKEIRNTAKALLNFSKDGLSFF
jgi:hypothetical protein